jgi:hypothetical protein
MKYRSKIWGTTLTLEHLEPRRLLTQVAGGIDADGDVYQIELSGPGTIDNADLAGLVTNSTSSSSRLTVEVINPLGDGLVNVASLDTSGLNLGRIMIQGDLGGLSVQKVSQLQVDSLGAVDGTSRVYEFGLDADKIIVNNGITDSQIDIQGGLGLLKVGNKDNVAGNISGSQITIAGDLDNLQALQSVTAGSEITVEGTLKNATIAKSLINSNLSVDGPIQKLLINGSIRQNSQITAAGDIASLQVRKDAIDTEISADGTIKNLAIGNDFNDSSLTAKGVDRLTVGDDLNDCQINIESDLLNFGAGDVNGLTMRIGGSLRTAQVARDFQNALVSVLNDITTLKIGQDLNRATIIAGIDIGPDLTLGTDDDGEWGDLDISSVTVGGDMIDSSIAAGVKTSPDNSDPWYGNGNDVRAYNDGTGTAHIKKITVKGEITTSFMPGESYAISADDGIDSIRAAGKEFTGVPGVAKQEF